MNAEREALKRIWEREPKPHTYQQNCAYIRGVRYFRTLPPESKTWGGVRLANGLMWAMFPEGPP